MSSSKRVPAVLLTLGVAVLPLSGCGTDAKADGKVGGPVQRVGECRLDNSSVTGARDLVRIDLRGNGDPTTVRLTGGGGDCPNTLFAKVGKQVLSAQMGDQQPPVVSGSVIQVPGHDGQVLVTRQDHPRGGFQVRLFAASGDTLRELRSGKETLVPFVGTDTEAHFVSADCAADGIEVTQAVTHEPPGIAAAYDVTRTHITLADGTAKVGDPVKIADNVLPGQLPKKFPALERNDMFRGCTVSPS